MTVNRLRLWRIPFSGAERDNETDGSAEPAQKDQRASEEQSGAKAALVRRVSWKVVHAFKGPCYEPRSMLKPVRPPRADPPCAVVLKE